jgi:hypothetical protein
MKPLSDYGFIGGVEISRKRIRRGSFESVSKQVAAI